MRTILLADSGSTKTDWLLVAEDGTEVSGWTSQGINPFFQDTATISSVMAAEVFPHVPAQPASVFFYGAGCANRQVSEPVEQSLRMQFGQAQIEVESDLLGAARSVCHHTAGIACILGTGSNNCLYNGTEIIGNVGSLGFWMGDEGSGGHLGKQLVIAYLHRELPENLMKAFDEQYPNTDRLEVLNRAYKQPFPNRYFAGFTHFLGAHSADPYVIALLKSSFSVFLDKYVYKHPGASGYPVSFVGSVAWHFQEILLQTLREKKLHPGEIAQRPMPGLAKFHCAAIR